MAALVLHLMSPGAASVQQDWDAPDGSVSHQFVSWREIPPTVSSANLVVAHGLAALVVSQTLANVGPGLVYRPTGSARPRRRPWSRRLRASWVVAPTSRAGLANAAALGLDRDRVVVVRDDDRDAWNRLVSALVRYEQVDADLVPSRRGSPVRRALSRSAAARRATKVRKRQLRATQAAEAEARAAEVAERRAEAEAEARRAEQAAQAEAEEEARRVALAAEAEVEARRAQEAAEEEARRALEAAEARRANEEEEARRAKEAAEARRANEEEEARRAEEAAEARRAALAAEAETAARRAEAEADRATRAPVAEVDALVVDGPLAEAGVPDPEGRGAKVGRRQRRRAKRAAKMEARRAASAPVAEAEVPVAEVEVPVAEVEVPVAEADVAGRRAKGRRRQRRATRAAEAEARRAVSARIAEIEALVVQAPVVEAPESEVEAPVEDRRRAKERRRDRRGRREADVEAPVAEPEAPVAEAPAVEMPVVERPPEPPRIETPVPVPVPPPLPEPPPAPVPPPLPEPPPVPAPEPPPVVAAPAVAPPAVAARTDLPRIAPAAPRGRPRMVDTGSVEPTTPGLPWFRYRRMDVPPVSAPGDAPAGSMPSAAGSGGVRSDVHGPAPIDKRPGGNGAAGPGAGGNGSANGAGNVAWPPVGGEPPSGPLTPGADPGPEPEPERVRRGVDFVQNVGSGVGLFIIGMALVAVVVIGAQVKMTREGPFLIPLAGLFFVLAAGRRIVRKHPGEAWVANWLLLGYFVKIGACYFRYFTSTVTYGGGDVSGYDQIGRQFAQAWLTGGRAPVLLNLHQTNFIRWFTGVVYFIFGQNLVTGTFVFGLLAFVGSYFWYRATVEAVPIIDKKLYMGFVMFAPSIVFWPAEVGKEALMQLGLGAMALGLAYMLRQQLLTGLVVGVAGGWLVWIVRPHLLAMVAIGAGAAYLAGRTRPREGKKKAGLFSRPLGILIVAFLVAFTIGQGAKFLGLTSFSFSSIQTELNATTASSAQGGSSFNNGGHTLNPINYPQDVLTVLIRPFPWEVGGGLQVVASAEGMILAGLIIFRFESIRIAFRRSRESPYLMFCFVLVALYCIAFSSFANFGLLVRERSLVLPAVLVLVAVDPTFEHRRRAAEEAAARQSASPLGTRVPRDDVIA